jgi:hypothetical protein
MCVSTATLRGESRSRFPSPLIERSMQTSRTALSDCFTCGHAAGRHVGRCQTDDPELVEDRQIWELPGSARQNLVSTPQEVSSAMGDMLVYRSVGQRERPIAEVVGPTP